MIAFDSVQVLLRMKTLHGDTYVQVCYKSVMIVVSHSIYCNDNWRPQEQVEKFRICSSF